MEHNKCFKTMQQEPPVSSALNETDTVSLGGKKWSVVWTRHAKNRTVDRHSHPDSAAKVFILLLKKIESLISPIVNEWDGQLTIRAFPLKSTFVFCVQPESNELVIVTYADAKSFYPKYGDYVITLSEEGTVTATQWKKCRSADAQEGRTLLGKIA